MTSNMTTRLNAFGELVELTQSELDQQQIDAQIGPDRLLAYSKQKRSFTEDRGITVDGAPVASSAIDHARVANAYAGMLATNTPSINFKTESGFTTLSLEQMKTILSALFAHSQACFTTESTIHSSITSAPPTMTTYAEIDAAYSEIPNTF